MSVSSCGEPKIVKTVGGFDVDEDFYDVFEDNEEQLKMFFAVYALADEVGFDYKSDDFSSKCEIAKQQILAEEYGGDEKALIEEYKDAGMTDEVYDKFLEQDTLKNELYEYLISEGKIEADKDKLRAMFLSGEACRVKRMIFTGADAEQDAGISYERVASGRSTFESEKSDNLDKTLYGDIGNYEDSYLVVRGNYEKAYEDVCFSLSNGEVAKPFITSSGWCLVKRYTLTEEIVDDSLDGLVTSYTEGQYNIMLENKASEFEIK